MLSFLLTRYILIPSRFLFYPIPSRRLLDPEGKAFYTYAAQGAGVTRNIIIDKKGNIAFLTRLYDPKEFEEMVKVIDKLLKEK